jgi:hypothetical protein
MKLGMVVQSGNPVLGKLKLEDCEFGQPELHSKSLPKKEGKKERKEKRKKE